MFGCCVAGRLLQTNITQVDDTHAYFELPYASSINHVCVFLLGPVPFPDGFGAAVHFFWPGKGFQLLGMLSNEKPSAIFRLRGSFSSTTTSDNAQNAFYQQQDGSAGQDVTAILGLSIEPLGLIQAQISTLDLSGNSLMKAPSAADVTLLAERIVRHLFNYLSSFTGGGLPGADVAVPMSVIVRWYESFVAKVRAGGAGFLDRPQE